MSVQDSKPVALPYARGTMADRIRERASRVLRMRSFWALADQAIASASNYAIGVLVVRHLDPETTGAYSLLWELQFFLSSLHAALIVYPLSIRGTRLDVDRLRQITTIGLMLTLLLAIPFGGTLFLMGVWQSLAIAVFAAGAVLAFQVHETLRRALMSHFLYTNLIWGDAVAYLGMAAIVASLAAVGWLSVWAVFAAMTLTFALASFVQWWHLQPLPTTRDDVKGVAAEFWVLGRWMLASNCTLILTTLGIQWGLWIFQDLTHVAKVTAVVTMTKITNPMVAAMSGLIVPAVAREGNARPGLKYTLLGLSILGPYLCVLFALPEFSIRVFYGANSAYAGSSTELRVVVVSCLTGYLGAMFLAVLMGLGHSKSNFAAQVINSILSVAVALPMAIYWGWSGALLGGTIASVGTCAIALVLMIRALSDRAEP